MEGCYYGGEGLTALIPLDKNNPDILVKMDYMMPTLSFKDRGAAVLVAKAKEFGAKRSYKIVVEMLVIQ